MVQNQVRVRIDGGKTAPMNDGLFARSPRSMALASCVSTGRNSTPYDGATDWIAPHCPFPIAVAASRATATCDMPGAISFSSASHISR